MTKPAFSRRKRSGRVALTTMVALTGGAMLTACGEGDAVPAANAAQNAAKPADAEEVQVYENVFDCAKQTGKSRDECAAMQAEAAGRAAEEAPRFAALEDCEAEYGQGQCVKSGEEASSGHRRHFSPFIVGWFSSNKSAGNTPLFKSRAGGFQTANGMRLGYAGAPGKYYASGRAMERAKTVPKVKPASKLAKSGGFGSRAGSWNLSDRNGGGTRMGSRGG